MGLKSGELAQSLHTAQLDLQVPYYIPDIHFGKMLNPQVYYFSLWQYFIKYLSSSPVHTRVLIIFLSVKK